MFDKFFFFRLTQGESFLYEFLEFIKFQIRKILNLPYRLTRKSKIKKYYKSHNKIKVQFGCYTNYYKGFLNTDIFGKIPVDITKKLPFPSDSVDFIFTSHVIEHIYNRQFKQYMIESYRILKKGGIQIITTPSLTRMIEVAYSNNDMKQKLFDYHEKMQTDLTLVGGKLDPATYLNRVMHICYSHRFIYDFEAIANIGKMAGFAIIKKIAVVEIPDEILREKFMSLEKDDLFNLETEIFLLKK